VVLPLNQPPLLKILDPPLVSVWEGLDHQSLSLVCFSCSEFGMGIGIELGLDEDEASNKVAFGMGQWML